MTTPAPGAPPGPDGAGPDGTGLDGTGPDGTGLDGTGPGTAGARPVALVVEDDDDVAALLASHLQRLGWVCHRAATGEDGVALALAVGPELVLVDIGLPGMDGREVVRHLRGHEGTRGCVVAVTTVLDGDDLEDVRYDVLLPKPFSRRDVERLLAGVPRRAARPDRPATAAARATVPAPRTPAVTPTPGAPA